MKKIPVENYSRIVGYFRPVSKVCSKLNQWNKGKLSEWRDRESLDSAKIVEGLKDE